MSRKRQTFLVTGGAGFIGSHVVDRLLDQGSSVVCFDDFNDYYQPAFKWRNIRESKKKPGFHLIEGDIREKSVLQPAFREYSPSHVIHLAARAGVRASIAEPDLYYSTNIIGSLNVFDCAREHGVQNVIFASSSSVYGNQKKTPFSENDPVDHPISPYAASKKAVELLAYTFHHLYGMNMIGLRFFTVYGERGRPDMAPYLFTEAISQGNPITKFGDGSTRRDYTYIDDIVAGVLAACDANLGYDIINLGNSHTVELNRFIEIIESILGKKAVINQQPIQPGDVQTTSADIAKAEKILRFQPKISIEEGMQKFITWYTQIHGKS